MKKIIAFSLMMLISIFTYSQFVWTQTGLIDSKTNQPYTVLNIDSLSASNLYDNCVAHIKTSYLNPDFVMRGDSKNEFLSFVTSIENVFIINYPAYKPYFNITYLTSIYFKDGKVRIEMEIVKLTTNAGNYTYEFTNTKITGLQTYGTYVFNKKGEIFDDKLKIELETFFNNQVFILNDALINSSINSKLTENW